MKMHAAFRAEKQHILAAAHAYWPQRHGFFKALLLVIAIVVKPPGAAAASCDRESGERAFTACAACHSLKPGEHLMGPSLNGLAGRSAGKVPGFNFSRALRDSGLVWNAKTLDAFLAAPQTYVPGTVMPFGGIRNSVDRAALVCFLLQSGS